MTSAYRIHPPSQITKWAGALVALLLILFNPFYALAGTRSSAVSLPSSALVISLLPILLAIAASGAVIIDKPPGLTSHDVIARLRRITRTRRVGHAGTLDPFATGVLVVCFNTATRLVQFLVGLDKEYFATVRLGFATDTQDLTGKQVTPLVSSKVVSPEDIQRVMREFTGPQMQLPPMFSAKKVGGEPLYRAARAGRQVERAAVPVEIYSIEPLAIDGSMLLRDLGDGSAEFSMSVKCSSGTYVRTLAHEIGARLGVGGHLVALRRTAVGSFAVADSHSLERIEQMDDDAFGRALICPADLVAQLHAIPLEADDIKRIAHGQSVRLSDSEPVEGRNSGDLVRICDVEGELIAIARYEWADRLLKPIVVLKTIN